MEITNKAKRPIVVPLPGGRKLFLGLGQSAKLAPNAVDHPPVKHLVESGDAELKEKKSKKGKQGPVVNRIWPAPKPQAEKPFGGLETGSYWAQDQPVRASN